MADRQTVHGLLPGDGQEVLLLPQNDQHLETIRILVPRLAASALRCRILLMDGIFHQGLDATDLRGTARVEALPVELPRPFYRLDPVRQVVAVIRAVKPMRQAIGRPAVIVIFNDGALQRLAIRLAERAHVAMIIDGMISDYAAPTGLASRLRARLKRIGRLVRSTPLGIVLPSDVGLSPVAAVFVLGDHSAAVLRQMGARALRIVATGLPRWPHDDGPRAIKARRVLYLTAAFAWHARHDADASQVEDAATIAAVCRELGLELVVRVHPRDDPARWRAAGFRIVTAGDEPMTDSIRAADVVLAMVSTGLLEAVSLGRIARPVIIADSFDHYASSFVADPMLGAIRSVDGLRDALHAYRDGITPDDYARQESALAHYVAASGDEAAARIASAIAELAA